ncbi:MAG: mechanosensitive ion channel [Lentisphaeria bacterium]|nr:mechanosensitive ion channel [Lentisphaeria bacterium]NQZ66646.1 mechanosensitive ion channel [Lentisphaeria bacterium]
MKIYVFIISLLTFSIYGQSPLPSIDVSNPSATISSFMSAMNDYRQGVEKDKSDLKKRLADASFCLDLSTYAEGEKLHHGGISAKYLKEIIDRVVDVNDLKIPNDSSVGRYRLANTSISIVKITSGERAGDYLFSASTVVQAQAIYQRIMDKPFIEGTGNGALIDYKKVSKIRQDGLISPHRTDTPRATLKTFMEAMNDYRLGLAAKDKQKTARIDAAVRCLHLDSVPENIKSDVGQKAAIFLKETVDRIIDVDFRRVPEQLQEINGVKIAWKLKDTNLAINFVKEGPNAGMYLITKESVDNAEYYYKQVKDQGYHKSIAEDKQGALYKTPWAEENVPAWSKNTIIYLPNWQWIGIFIAILVGLLIKVIVQHFMGMIMKLTEKSKTDWDEKVIEAAHKPAGLIVASMFWYVSVKALQLPEAALAIMTVVVQILFSIGLIWLLYKLTDVLTEFLSQMASNSDNQLDDHLIPMLKRALRIFVVVFGLLITFQNLGYNVMSILAGLGLGGLAFALAAKDACANLFGSIMILTDRPFKVGDWVIVGDVDGSVEEVGFRSTRIRTFYNSVISVPNAVMANANIDNMGQREYRRIKAYFGLTYDTPPEKVEAFMEGIKNIVKANEYTRKDYFHVVFNSYQDSCLEIMLYCFLKVPDWSTELVQRQNIFLEVYRLAAELNVEFAFPTQTLHMESFPEKATPEKPGYEPTALAATAQSFGPGGDNAKPQGQGLFIPPHEDKDIKSMLDAGFDDES